MTKISFLWIALLLVINTQAQVGSATPWVWMKGDNHLYGPGNYGGLGVEDPSYTPTPRTGSNAFTGADGSLWMFGGFNFLPAPSYWLFMDLWKYNPNTNSWSMQKGGAATNGAGVYGTMGVPASTNQPSARSFAASWTDASGNFWLFGGYGVGVGSFGPGDGSLGDLWKFEPGTGNWTWMKGTNTIEDAGSYGSIGIPAASNNPPGRSSATAWADNQGNLWLFGGANDSYAMNDLWRYNIAANTWTWIKGSNNTSLVPGAYGTQGVSAATNYPGGRSGATGWLGANNTLYMFGGTSGDNAVMNDLWKYTPATNEWTWLHGSNTVNQPSVEGTKGVSASGNTPGAMAEAGGFTDNSGNFWLMGGWGIEGSTYNNALNYLWKYSPLTNQWTWMKGDPINSTAVYGTQGVAGAANTPGGRSSHNTWSTASGDFWVFGGFGWGPNTTMGKAEMNDLWKISSNALLPLRLLSFTGIAKNNTIELQWKAEGLESTSEFIVEKSIDGAPFNALGKIAASDMQRDYSFSDRDGMLAGTRLDYRLRIVDKNNSPTYSKIVSFNTRPGSFKVYPNPAGNTISFSLPQGEINNSHYTVTDMAGKMLMHGIVQGNTNTINVSALVPGTYRLLLSYARENKVSFFIKK